MAKKVKKGSIGVKVFGTLVAMVVIIAFTVICDIGALGTIGSYNEVIGEACLGIERVNGQLAASVQKLQMYSKLLHYEQVGDISLVYRDILKSANEEVKSYGASLRNIAQSTDDETLKGIADTYLLSVSELIDCAERLIAAVEAFDRKAFYAESDLLRAA